MHTPFGLQIVFLHRRRSELQETDVVQSNSNIDAWPPPVHGAFVGVTRTTASAEIRFVRFFFHG